MAQLASQVCKQHKREIPLNRFPQTKNQDLGEPLGKHTTSFRQIAFYSFLDCGFQLDQQSLIHFIIMLNLQIRWEISHVNNIITRLKK